MSDLGEHMPMRWVYDREEGLIRAEDQHEPHEFVFDVMGAEEPDILLATAAPEMKGAAERMVLMLTSERYTMADVIEQALPGLVAALAKAKDGAS